MALCDFFAMFLPNLLTLKYIISVFHFKRGIFSNRAFYSSITKMIRALAGMWTVQVPVEKLQPDSRLKASGLMDDGGASTCVFLEIGMLISHHSRISSLCSRQQLLPGATVVALIPAAAPAECQDT